MNISKKNIVKLIGYLVAGGIVGFGGALSLNYIGKSGYLNFLVSFREFLIHNNIYLFPILFIIFFIPIYFIGSQGRKQLDRAQEVSDDLYDDLIQEAEKKIDIAMSLNGIFMVLNFILLGISFAPRVDHVFFALGMFLFNVIAVSLYEISTIRFIQKNDNRLKGDPVSMRFRKDFFESCDEAEKQKILKTSYHSLNLARNVSLALLVVSMFSHMILETGIFAIIISGIMLLSIIAGYSYYALFKE